MNTNYKILDKIKNPSDVKLFDYNKLNLLAEEIRRRILEVVSQNGGHLASSLGTVEISIALLKIFSPLKNPMVWDVGHQAYAYKILTERNEKFDTLRTFEGISGFNNIFESKYDAFGVGHSSTSISAALGISKAKKLLKDKEKTIAIIGDGSITGGMAFEAINHAGEIKDDNLIVILNDNNMSISQNVGGLQKYLTDFMISKPYLYMRKEVYEIVQKIPLAIRNFLINNIKKLEESFVNIFVPNIIFEGLGFKYIGPVNGHNIERLCTVLKSIKENNYGKPILLHVLTKKGKGYSFAENDPSKYHGVSSFDIKTGQSLSVKSEKSYSKIFGQTLCKLAEKNKKICAVVAAMEDGVGLSDFAKNYPERFFDVAIAEQHAITFACGLAIKKFKPFVAIYSTFMQRAFDQILHDLALQNLPVVLCLDRAGLVGEDGATHHGIFDISYLNLIPNMKILAPTCDKEFEEMLAFSASYYDAPLAIRYPRGKVYKREKYSNFEEIGKFELVEDGENIAIFGVGSYFKEALEIHSMLKDKLNLNAMLINPRTLKPLDYNFLDNLTKKVKIIITLEEGSLIGGFSSMLKNYFINENIKIYSFGIKDKFVAHGKTSILQESLELTAIQIFEKIKNKLEV